MVTSSRFPVAVHILALLAMQKRSLSSTAIAASVNTNPVVIRRILGSLAQAGLVLTQLGSEGGATLARPAEQINLLEVQHATEKDDLFTLNTGQASLFCPCGKNIQPVLANVYAHMEAAVEEVLAHTTIAQVVQDIEVRINT